MDQGLAGKRVLITGGSRGIGRATALAFARAGARVVACHHRVGEDADSLAHELKTLGGGNLVVAADVTQRADVARLVRICQDHLGGLDVLVNNVGVDGRMPFAALDDAEWDRVFDHNVTAAYRVIQASLDVLVDGASVVNVGASVALRGRPMSAHYTAAKAALLGLGRSLAKELGPRGIRVNTVAPGVTSVAPEKELPPPVLQHLLAATALGRLAAPEDVAGAILFLAGDASRLVTGVELPVDGGI
ncbi:SDR family NAD(P)-dependent oxidoreductase [Couchioplanes azureus]|uniref:SDR family NAD(P)-dependent oxidoreductase n=1 Tax=Couchioplanes caeruleus TaxID=56438 RepID=UPI0016717C66|nr:SDR family NAD(P)-dependent oxidoreductase [Couchioplanes caeruleus]GGQ80941.1 short-chain dehydrogenase [Couchioplanes caeruleus subsp. azureus]